MPIKKAPDKWQAKNRMRRKIIGLLREFNPQRFEVWSQEKGRMVANMEAIEAFIIKHGYLHKSLNDYRYHELPELVSQIEKINQWYTNKLAE